MRLASLKDGSLDGHLLIVSRDMRFAVSARPLAQSMLDALQRWDEVEPQLAKLSEALNAGQLEATPFDPKQCSAPLPRAPQWCDASAFLNHGRLMERAFKTTPIPDFETIPVMY